MVDVGTTAHGRRMRTCISVVRQKSVVEQKLYDFRFLKQIIYGIDGNFVSDIFCCQTESPL